MDDVRSLCSRSIVINKGCKIYDGDTESLFESFQTDRKITIQFDSKTVFVPPAGCNVIETGLYRTILMVPKSEARNFLEIIMRDYHPGDITIEEEDIGVVVDKIYKSRTEGLI